TLTRLSYFHKPGKNPFLPWTMGEVVDRTADAKGDNIAIVSCHQGIAKTFTELRDEVNQFAASLVSLKLPLGSKIGMLAPNIYEWMVVKFAVAKAGLVLGTTGRPKAAMLSHFNVVNNANMIGRGFGLHEQSELICLNAPMIHCYGIVVGTLTAAMFGSTTVMPAPSFKAEAALDAITKH
ncbi:AMP dependent CoA ligase, putative, partial [Ixodes scapularis]